MFQHFFYCILKFSLYYYCQVKLLVTGFGLLTLGAVYKPVQTSNHDMFLGFSYSLSVFCLDFIVIERIVNVL